jgi:hypothetical protein
MPNVGFFLGLLHESRLWEHFQHPGSCHLDYVQLTEQMFLVLFVYLPLADKDVVEGLFDQHVQYVIVLVLEEEVDEDAEKTDLAYLGEDAGARYRYAVAEHLQQFVVVEVHLSHGADAV